MKALLMAAALALPLAANAQETGTTGNTNTRTGTGLKTPPSQTTNRGYGQPEAGTQSDRSQSGTLSGARSGSAIGADELFSEGRVIDKIHHVNQKHVEYGNLARTRASNTQLRKFGAKLVKDHQKLDEAVFSYAKQNKLQLGESEKELQGRSQLGYGGDRSDDLTIAGSDQASTGSTGGAGTSYGTRSDSVAQAGRNDGLGATGQSGAMGGSGTDEYGTTGGSTQRANDVGSTGNSNLGRSGAGASDQRNTVATGDVSGTSTSTQSADGEKTPQQKREEFQAKLDELKNLQGAEFDAQFLSNVVDASQRSIEKLNGWKGQGDKKLDGLIDRAVRVLGDHQREAERLQQKVPAA